MFTLTDEDGGERRATSMADRSGSNELTVDTREPTAKKQEHILLPNHDTYEPSLKTYIPGIYIRVIVLCNIPGSSIIPILLIG